MRKITLENYKEIHSKAQKIRQKIEKYKEIKEANNLIKSLENG